MNRKLVEKFVIPKTEGKGFIVRKGQVLRTVQIEGPQICDVNAFNLDNPRETFWAGRTRIIEGAHLHLGSPMWSVEPWMRVMFRITADTTTSEPTARGARMHDLWYPRCNRRYHQVFFDESNRPNCHTNLTNAIKGFGLTEDYVHDTLNLFMCTGLDPKTDKYFAEPSPTKKGDYVELTAEMDCIVAISCCPGHVNPELLPLGIEIYELS